MNEVELMQGKLLIMERRVRRLEVLFEAEHSVTADEKAAQKIAGELGFDIEIFLVPKRLMERKRLAGVLRGRDWSAERIARVLKCSEKTVRLWLA